jgi:general secretion pathway protein C
MGPWEGRVNDNDRMVSRIAAFVTWAAVAASIVFWAVRLWVQGTPVPANTVVVSNASGFNGDLGRVLGVDAAPAEMPMAAEAPRAPADARFRLVGVVAPRSAAASAQGLALIAMDGKPPKAYRVGTEVDGGLVLQAVHARGASLGPRGQAAVVDLALPVLPPPTAGGPGAGAMLPPRSGVALPGRLAPPAATALVPPVSLSAPPPGSISAAPAVSAAEAAEPTQDEPATERPPSSPGRTRLPR